MADTSALIQLVTRGLMQGQSDSSLAPQAPGNAGDSSGPAASTAARSKLNE